jgi:hypothetical protein
MALTTMMDPNGVFMEIAFARVQSVLSSHRRACRAPHAQSGLNRGTNWSRNFDVSTASGPPNRAD